MTEEFEREFLLKDTDPLLFFGANDRNLKIIEKHFSVILFGRGDKIMVTGKESDVDQVIELLSEIIFIINKNKRLTRTDLVTAIQIIKGESREERENPKAKDELNSVVLFTDSGYVKPNTPGQIEYMQIYQR